MVDRTVVRFAGPLAVHSEALRSALLARGYAPLSATNLLRLAAHLSRWLEAHSLCLEQVSPERIAEFLAARRAEGYSSFFTPRALAPILRYLEQVGLVSLSAAAVTPSGAADRLLYSYTQYLQRERCLTPGCVRSYSGVAREFLCQCFGDGQAIDIAALKAHEVTSFALYTSGRYSIGTAKYAVTALRSFLRYLYLEGQVAVDFSGALPAVAGWRLTGLPKALTASQVRKLLRACDRRRHLGRRDYAVLLLLARMGLRAGEVSALELEDVDWPHGEILVHGKGRRKERLPLPTDVGAALASYLRLSRPSACTRRCFLCVRAPRGPLNRTAVTALVRYACTRADLPVVGAHRLRHTAATEMLRAGGSLDEIAQVLRHRSHDTTAIYAKVDRSALRTLARRWPGGAS
jgi:site-specific recombinase XerD